MRRRPLLLLPIMALLCASTPILPAAATDGSLPGGTPLSVTIDTPPNNVVLPPGPVTVTGRASIGVGNPQDNIALVYVLDVSGSTDSTKGCGGELLDCEVAAAKKLNEQAVAAHTVDKVSVVVFADRAAIADVSPAPGDQDFTDPEAADSEGHKFIDTVLNSAFSDKSGGDGGVTQFTAQDRAVGQLTFYSNAIVEATRAANATGKPKKIVAFMSDGINDRTDTIENALAGAIDSHVVFKTFAVGPAGPSVTCGDKAGNSLEHISTATGGGACMPVEDVEKLPTIVPELIKSQLTELTLSIDGVGAIPATITDPDKQLPLTGPNFADYRVTTPPLGSGRHDLCVTAGGTDVGGPGSVHECHTVVINAAPVVRAGGPYSGTEDNPVELLGSVSDDDDGATVTATWTIAPADGVPPDSVCTFGDVHAPRTTVTCTERGTYTLTLTGDDHVNPPVTSTTTVTLRNVAPTVSAGGPYSGNEDNDVAIAGVVTDPDGPAPAVAWSIEAGAGVPAGSSCVFGNPNVLTTTVNCTERGTYTLTLTADDHVNPPVSATTTVTLTNVKPTVSAGGPYTGEEDHPVAIVGKVTDPDSPGLTTTWKIVANPGVDPAAICSFVDPSKLSTVVTCSEPGGYTLTLTVDDKANPPVVVTTTVTLSQTLGQLSMITSVAPQTGFVGGDPVVVTHTVHNAGPAVMKGVRLTTTIPGGLQVADVSQAGCAATCELGTLAPGQTVQVRISFATTAPGDQVVSAAVTTTGPDIDPNDNGGSVRVVIRRPALTVDPGAGPQGFVPHVTGTDFPPGARVKLQWAIGISETPAEWVVGGDGRLDAWALVFPKDTRGSRTLLATSVAGQRFGPVESTPFLVLPRPLQPMDFVIR